MAQREDILHTSGSRPFFGPAVWATFGAVLLIGLFCVTLAIADGTVYLRTMMPHEDDQPIIPHIESETEIAIDAAEQRLLERLYQDDQDIVYNVLNNNQRWRVVQMRVTAYCPCPICCGKFSDGITASNHRIRQGDVFVAADKMYGFGTEMIVPGYNNTQAITVQDRGRVIKGNRLDVFFNSHSVAKEWGSRTLDVLVREN